MSHKSDNIVFMRNKNRRRRNNRKRRNKRNNTIIRVLIMLVLLAGLAYGTITIYGKEVSESKKQEEEIITTPSLDEQEHETEETANIDESKDSNTKLPGESNHSDTTKKPEVTKVPEVTKQPEATLEPEITKTPEVSQGAEITKDPTATTLPDVSTGQGTAGDAMDDSFFDDALFIGDSRTDGFGVYSGLKNATFYAEKGLMVNTILTEKVVKIDGQKMTVLEALEKKSFHKIYIMFGVNELGWPYESVFIKRYTELVESIKELQPQADIYVQSIIHVNNNKIKNEQTYLNNELIDQRNKRIQEMAEELDVSYLDLNSVLTDEDGSLFYDASTDGIHLNKEYCQVWKNYLLENKKSEGETQ